MMPQTETTLPPDPATGSGGHAAWRGVATAALDAVFDTDAEGRLTRVAPRYVLGRDTRSLLGQPLGTLWNTASDDRPRAGRTPSRRVVHGADHAGRPVDLLLTYTPYQNADGLFSGVRGGLIIIGDEIAPGAQAIRQPDAPTLRRVVEALRAALLPRNGILAAFGVLAQEIGADGGALVSTGPLSPHEPSPIDGAFQIIHRFGTWNDHSERLAAKLEPSTRTGALRRREDRFDFLLSCERVRHFGQIGLLFWRSADKPWSAGDGALCAAVTSTFSALIELDGVHRNLLRDAHFDPGYNILTWVGFRSEVRRRTARLDREHLSATLMLVAIEGLSALVSSLGFADGENAMRQCIELLRAAVRPTDLVARIGSDTFALWMDGGDRFAAAERAERMCIHGAPIILDPPHRLSVSMGLVAREAETTEPIEVFLERASLALRSARDNGGGWLFSHDAP